MAHDATIPEIKALLAARIDDLVRTLAPGPQSCRKGDYWMPPNPARNDKRPGSFWVLMRKNPGVWKDEATGDTGDVLSLIKYTQGLASVGDAIRWAKDWLGIARIKPDEIKRVAREADADRRHQEESAALDLEAQRKRAKGFWLSCDARIGASPAGFYLASRGIDVDLLPRYPSALRFCREMKHTHIDGETGEIVDTFWPGLVAAMTHSETEQIAAVHRTYLAPDGTGKAPVDPARKIWPSFKGAAIRLARGETGMPPGEAAKAGRRDRLALTEGVEDGLSVALACPELRVWAVGSLGNLGNIRIPACTAEVIVCADNDWGKRQAEALLEKGIASLVAQGARVRVARSHIGKDVNDCLRGEAA
jgi:hypothetical protein